MRLLRRIIRGLLGSGEAGEAPVEFPRTADGTGGTADSDEFTADRGPA